MSLAIGDDYGGQKVIVVQCVLGQGIDRFPCTSQIKDIFVDITCTDSIAGVVLWRVVVSQILP